MLVSFPLSIGLPCLARRSCCVDAAHCRLRVLYRNCILHCHFRFQQLLYLYRPSVSCISSTICSCISTATCDGVPAQTGGWAALWLFALLRVSWEFRVIDVLNTRRGADHDKRIRHVQRRLEGRNEDCPLRGQAMGLGNDEKQSKPAKQIKSNLVL